MYADSAYSQKHYYIRPSLHLHCPLDPYLTLAQFAASYLGNETDMSLSFLPGNHSLNRELSLSHADNFNGNVFVECGSQSGRLNISMIAFATIKGLHFIGCGGISVSQVEQFIVEDTIFQGVEGRGTALVLNEVIAASIMESSILSNTYGSTFEYHEISNFTISQATLNYLYLKRGLLLTVGGALYTAFSNVSIVNSKFTDNTAEIGGALFACNSSLHVVGSTLSYNRACFGRVMITSESSVNIDSSTFSKNAAMLSGRTFTNNSSAYNGGVICTFDFSFNITSSAFANNAADNGGIMVAFRSSFTIIGINFTNNNATDGGDAIFGGITLSIESSTYISDSIFDSNSGSLYIFNSNLTFSGYTRFKNCAESLDKMATGLVLGQEGGAVISFRGGSRIS